MSHYKPILSSGGLRGLLLLLTDWRVKRTLSVSRSDARTEFAHFVADQVNILRLNIPQINRCYNFTCKNDCLFGRFMCC